MQPAGEGRWLCVGQRRRHQAPGPGHCRTGWGGRFHRKAAHLIIVWGTRLVWTGRWGKICPGDTTVLHGWWRTGFGSSSDSCRADARDPQQSRGSWETAGREGLPQIMTGLVSLDSQGLRHRTDTIRSLYPSVKGQLIPDTPSTPCPHNRLPSPLRSLPPWLHQQPGSMLLGGHPCASISG